TAGPVAPLGPGEELCQRPIPVPAGGAFDRIRVVLGTYDRPGPPLLVSVSRGGSTIATGHLSAGYADIAKEPSHIVHVRPVSAGGRIDVCLRNAGPNRVAVFGNADAATATSTAFRDGKPLHSDIGLIFE